MERGPKGGFEAGQPIDTDDAMNDLPENNGAIDTYKQMVEKRVESGDLKREDADAMIAKAEAKHEENVQNEADTAAYEAWANMAPDELNAHHDAIVNDFEGEQERSSSLFSQYPRMAGESNEEYGARIHQISEATKQFRAENPEPVVEEPKVPETALDTYKQMVEKRVESGDLKREDADKMIANREAQYNDKVENSQKIEDFNEAQEKAKMEMAEKIRKEVPEALEFLEKHPELKVEMAAAVKKLEELEELTNIKENADKAIDDELVKRNEKFMQAVEAFNAAARANEEARAKMADLESRAQKGEKISDEEFAKAEEEIHNSEKTMAEAEAERKDVASNYDEFEAKTREEAENRSNEINERMNERDKFVEEEREKYNEQFEAANGDAEKIAELKQNQEEIAATMNGEGENAGEAEAEGEEKEKAEFDEFAKSYLDDPEWRAHYMKDGVFDEEACLAGLKNLWEEKKKLEAEEAQAEEDRAVDIRRMMDEDEANKAEAEGEEAESIDDEEDGFENEEQRGLFSKLKNFFNRNKRSKDGAERALNKESGSLRGWKKYAYAAMLALLVGTSLANTFQNTSATADGYGGGVANASVESTVDQAVEDEGEDEVNLEDVAENLSLNADLGDGEQAENLDIIHTKYVDGTDLEIDLDYGSYEGSAFFAEGKDGPHSLTPWLYDHNNTELTGAEKATQTLENLNDLADDPVMQGQIAALMGPSLSIDGHSVTSFEDMRHVQYLAQVDEGFRVDMANNGVKEELRNLEEGNTVNMYTVAKDTTYSSLYAVNVAPEGEEPRMMYFVDNEVTANQDFEVAQFLNEDGENVLDSNEIGGPKYNFLKAVGVIPENATDEEAKDIMEKNHILGISGKCGQVIWVHVNPDTGSEPTGSEPTGSEPTGSEPTGSEPTGSEPTGSEPTGSEPTGSEPTGSEPTGSEPTGSEPTGAEPTGVEPTGVEPTGVEPTGSEPTGSEPTGEEITSKTDEKVASDDWDRQDVTDYDESTRGETVVTEEDTGRVDDEASGTSSDVADENFLNGGDQGGGNTDADGGGSTNPDTEATYDGSDTSGYDNGAQQEAGTQTVSEPTQQDTYQQNNSEADGGSRPAESVEQGDNNAPSNEEKANMMNDMF